jgi:RimJ/RimL family protein N-acetyltransferase
MDLNIPLFEGQLVYLSSIKPDQDAEIESRWTHDAEFQRLLGKDLVRPLSAAQIKKKYAEIEKDMDEQGKQFYFTIRCSPNIGSGETEQELDRLLGFAKLDGIEWSHGVSSLSLGIGSPDDRGKGYGSDALRLLLGYAFRELNLFRVDLSVPEYNQAAVQLFEKAAFSVEARRREALFLEGKRWDMLHMGLLREEWERRAS